MGHIMSMTDMNRLNRRTLLKGAAGTALLAAAGCSNAVGTNATASLDARVDATNQFLLQNYPSAQGLIDGAKGVLYMPLMTEAALGVGGAYGQGALRINGATVDYYSAT